MTKNDTPHTYTRQITQEVADSTGKLEELAEVCREIDRVKAEKAAKNAEFNKEVKDLNTQRLTILDTVDSGTEKVDVEVYNEPDWDRHEVVTKRKDNDQPIPELTRPMTASERQMSLEDFAAASAPAEAE